MKIRPATINNLDKIRQLFYNTILFINSKDYTEDQVTAWAAGYNNIDSWRNKIKEQHFFVAEIDNKIAGFGSLTKNGYLDLLYVDKDYQRSGIAKRLLTKIEMLAKKLSLTELTSEVSITATPFFLKHGFKIITEQYADMKGVKLTNFKMIKIISS